MTLIMGTAERHQGRRRPRGAALRAIRKARFADTRFTVNSGRNP
jgi:hypothetical protein